MVFTVIYAAPKHRPQHIPILTISITDSTMIVTTIAAAFNNATINSAPPYLKPFQKFFCSPSHRL